MGRAVSVGALRRPVKVKFIVGMPPGDIEKVTVPRAPVTLCSRPSWW